MKKIFLILCAVAMVGFMAGPPAFAYNPLGTNITIYDGKEQSPNYTGTGVGREVNETEPGTVTTPIASWDFEGFFLNGNTLTAVAKFDLALGAIDTNGTSRLPVGDLFIKTDGTPLMDTSGFPNVNKPNTVSNSTYNTYTYAVIFNSHDSLNAGQAYSLTGTSQLFTAQGNAVNSSNPWQYAKDGTSIGSPLTWVTGQLDATDPSGFGGHYFAQIDLSSLTGLGNAHFKLTYQCGNDDLHGKVPLPGAVLLLGAGMARLVAYARRRKEI
jgi:hypothetical protein